MKSGQQQRVKRYNAEYYQTHRQDLIDAQKRYRQGHTEEIKHNNQASKGRYRTYKKSAKRRELIFTLTLEQFTDITNNTCTYCDQFSKGKEFTGIDRLVNTEGYNLANCIPCCDVCNFMKSDMTVSEFLGHIHAVNTCQRLETT
jgi:hypothetical protein